MDGLYRDPPSDGVRREITLVISLAIEASCAGPFPLSKPRNRKKGARHFFSHRTHPHACSLLEGASFILLNYDDRGEGPRLRSCYCYLCVRHSPDPVNMGEP
jgi:hypothetical protein